MAVVPQQGVFWIGSDNNVWVRDSQGVRKVDDNFISGARLVNNGGFTFIPGVGQYNKIADPNPQPSAPAGGDIGGGGVGGGGGAFNQVVVDPRAAEEARQRELLLGRINTRGSEIDRIYGQLFGDLDSLIQARSGELAEQYGDQLRQATDQYRGFLPQIESSYSALGAARSTDLRDANIDAKTGYEETARTIGKNREKDETELGRFRSESRARFKADRDAARQAIKSAGETTDIGALRGLANDLDSNIRQAGVTRASLGTDGDVRRQIQGLTQDAGRYDQAISALDSILRSSLSGDVKNAAIQAVTNAGGLSEEEKKRVQQQYGNVYAEQAAL